MTFTTVFVHVPGKVFTWFIEIEELGRRVAL